MITGNGSTHWLPRFSQGDLRDKRMRKLLLPIVASFLFIRTAQADPFDFLRRLGDSIKKAGHHQSEAKSSPKPKQQKTTAAPKENPVRPPEPKEIEEQATPTPTQTPTPEAVSRGEQVAPSAKSKRMDLPYGMPVPNKPGFVRSPYSPNSGYVDVRGFPSGTEVKDPYTGKVFLTP